MKKNVMIALILFLAAAFVFAGGEKESAGGTAAQAAGPVTIEFSCWGISEAGTKPAFEAMIAGFEKKYPSIKVNVTGYAYNAVQEQLLLRAAGNTLPDVAQVAPIWVAGLAKMGVVTPVNQALPQEVFTDFFPDSLTGTTISGQVMSAPWIIAPILMYYNKTLLARVGYNAPPKTWGEMLDAAKKVAALGKDADGNQLYGRTISSKMLFGAGYFFFPDIWQNGGEFVDSNGKIVFSSAGTVAAFKSAQEQFASGIVAPGLAVNENRQLFGLGQVAFHFDVASQVNTFVNSSPKGADFKKEFGVIQIPGVKDPNGISFSSDHHLVISKNSKYPKEAALLVEYLTGPEGIGIKTANGVSVLPGRKSAMNIPYFTSSLDEFDRAYLDALPVTRSLQVQNANFISACEKIVECIQRVCLNKEDPAAAVAQTDKALKELYEQ
jgi:multiple sugar transport system substrate-binding protein